jgi:hypothetical protein
VSPASTGASSIAAASSAVTADDFVEHFIDGALWLAGARKTDLIAVAGPKALEAMALLCRRDFDHVEYAWRATCVVADRPRDLLLLAGRMDAEALGRTVRLTARLLREGGLLVAELARPEDEAVIVPALAAQGRCAGTREVSDTLVAARVIRRRLRGGGPTHGSAIRAQHLSLW